MRKLHTHTLMSGGIVGCTRDHTPMEKQMSFEKREQEAAEFVFKQLQIGHSNTNIRNAVELSFLLHRPPEEVLMELLAANSAFRAGYVEYTKPSND